MSFEAIQRNDAELRGIPRNNSCPDLSKENYEVNEVWTQTFMQPKSVMIEEFMKEARKKQFKHVFRSECRIPKPTK